MKKIEMSKEEKRWRAEDDFRTLTAYEELVADPDRLAAAKNIAKEKQNQILKVLKIKDKKEA